MFKIFPPVGRPGFAAVKRRAALLALGGFLILGLAYVLIAGELATAPTVTAQVPRGELADGEGAAARETETPEFRDARDETPAADPGLILQEARDNPHQTPPSLIEFAHQLAGPMERALKSETDARPVFAQMESCANDRTGSQAIQARVVCLANAGRLAEQYPLALAARYRALTLANPAIASILDSTGL